MRKRVLSSLLAMAMMGTLLAGCGSDPVKEEGSPGQSSGSQSSKPEESGNQQAAEDATAEPAKLQLVIYGDKSNRMREFEANELKERVLKDLNCELVLTYLPWSEYGGGKTDLMLANGEDFACYTDVGYTARCVTKGTAADLTESAENYLQDLKAVVQEEAFDCYTLDGKLYSIPIGNKPNSGEGYCITVRQDLLEEVGMSEIHNLEELEKFYDLCKEKHPDYIGFSSQTNIGQILSYEISDKNIEFVDARVSEKAMIYTDADAEDDVLYNWYASEEFKKCAEIARRWYEKGITPEYVLSNPNQLGTDWNAGKCMFKFGNAAAILSPDNSLLSTTPSARVEVYFLNRGDRPKINTQMWNTAWLVSSGAKDVDRYVMLFNYMQKNQENIDFLTYGVEGKDYTVSDGIIERTTTDNLFDGWMLENKYFMRYDKSASEETIEEYMHWDDDSIVGKSVGFMFDEEPVQVEKAALDAIVEELGKPILYGVIPYEDNIDTLLQRMEDAGFEKYFAEMQRQFSEFRAEK